MLPEKVKAMLLESFGEEAFFSVLAESFREGVKPFVRNFVSAITEVKGNSVAVLGWGVKFPKSMEIEWADYEEGWNRALFKTVSRTQEDVPQIFLTFEFNGMAANTEIYLDPSMIWECGFNPQTKYVGLPELLQATVSHSVTFVGTFKFILDKVVWPQVNILEYTPEAFLPALSALMDALDAMLITEEGSEGHLSSWFRNVVEVCQELIQQAVSKLNASSASFLKNVFPLDGLTIHIGRLPFSSSSPLPGQKGVNAIIAKVGTLIIKRKRKYLPVDLILEMEIKEDSGKGGEIVVVFNLQPTTGSEKKDSKLNLSLAYVTTVYRFPPGGSLPTPQQVGSDLLNEKRAETFVSVIVSAVGGKVENVSSS